MAAAGTEFSHFDSFLVSNNLIISGELSFAFSLAAMNSLSNRSLAVFLEGLGLLLMVSFKAVLTALFNVEITGIGFGSDKSNISSVTVDRVFLGADFECPVRLLLFDEISSSLSEPGSESGLEFLSFETRS